jgi:phosphoribosylaminoimidazole-succinocarboxamide synthase
MSTLYDSAVRSLPLLHKGKIRDIYGVDDKHLLIVTTDRLSAFDVVLPDPIPNKGKVLTALSLFWGNFTRDILPNHFTNLRLSDVLTNADERAPLEGQATIVRKLKALPVEAIVRGYLVGSGWKDYQKTGAVCGIGLPAGLQQAAQLPDPIFTPSTKAAVGEHDENVDFAYISNLIGEEMANKVRNASLQLYLRAREYAAARGIIIADTKFEFGIDENGNLVLIDEVLTPDSSRFWPADQYQLGISPPSFDKQFVRDYLETLDWNKKAPAPHLPSEILNKTADKYHEAQTRLMS